MNEELEQAKLSLQNMNDLVDIKGNPVVSSILMAPIKAIPVIGDLVDSTTDELLENFQQKKAPPFSEAFTWWTVRNSNP